MVRSASGSDQVVTFALAGGIDQVRTDVLDGFAVLAGAEFGVQHVGGEHGRPATVVSLAGGGARAFDRSIWGGSEWLPRSERGWRPRASTEPPARNPAVHRCSVRRGMPA